jgi:hypothetical protein
MAFSARIFMKLETFQQPEEEILHPEFQPNLSINMEIRVENHSGT